MDPRNARGFEESLGIQQLRLIHQRLDLGYRLGLQEGGRRQEMLVNEREGSVAGKRLKMLTSGVNLVELEVKELRRREVKTRKRLVKRSRTSQSPNLQIRNSREPNSYQLVIQMI